VQQHHVRLRCRLDALNQLLPKILRNGLSVHSAHAMSLSIGSWATRVFLVSAELHFISPTASRSTSSHSFVAIPSYWGQSFRIDISTLADQKINPKGLTPIRRHILDRKVILPAVRIHYHADVNSRSQTKYTLPGARRNSAHTWQCVSLLQKPSSRNVAMKHLTRNRLFQHG